MCRQPCFVPPSLSPLSPHTHSSLSLCIKSTNLLWKQIGAGQKQIWMRALQLIKAELERSTAADQHDTAANQNILGPIANQCCRSGQQQVGIFEFFFFQLLLDLQVDRKDLIIYSGPHYVNKSCPSVGWSRSFEVGHCWSPPGLGFGFVNLGFIQAWGYPCSWARSIYLARPT